MILALISVLYAFEFKSFEKYEITRHDLTPDNTPVIFIEPTIQKEPLPPLPEPSTKIKVDITNKADDKGIIIDVSTTEKTPIPDYNPSLDPDPPIDEPDIPISIPSEMPTFPGGYGAMMSFLKGNITYPSMAHDLNITGTVYLKFVVEKDGSITSIEILREVGGGCTEEAIRVVSMMPKWNCGRQNGIPVRVMFNLPIKFSLL